MQIRFSEKDLSGGSRIPEGEHEVTITSIEQKASKAGNPQLEAVLTDKYGRTEKEFLPLSENAKWKIAQFAVAAGIPKEELAAGGLSISKLVNRKMTMVKKKTDKTVERNGQTYPVYSQEFFQLLSPSATNYTTSPGEDEVPF